MPTAPELVRRVSDLHTAGMMRRRACVLAATAALGLACGSRTGIELPKQDQKTAAGADASEDAIGDEPAPDSGLPPQDTGSEVTDGTTTCPAVPIPYATGWPTAQCESCVASRCGSQQCACLSDPNVFYEDAGAPVVDGVPICDLVVTCTYEDVRIYVSEHPGTSLAMAAAAVGLCTINGTGDLSGMLGDDLFQCIITSCGPPCFH